MVSDLAWVLLVLGGLAVLAFGNRVMQTLYLAGGLTFVGMLMCGSHGRHRDD